MTEDKLGDILVESRRGFIKRGAATAAVAATAGTLIEGVKLAENIAHNGEVSSGYSQTLEFMYKSENDTESYVKVVTDVLSKGLIEHPDSFDPNKESMFVTFDFSTPSGGSDRISYTLRRGGGSFNLRGVQTVETSGKEETLEMLAKVRSKVGDFSKSQTNPLLQMAVSLEGYQFDADKATETVKNIGKFAKNDNWKEGSFSINELLELDINGSNIGRKDLYKYFSLVDSSNKEYQINYLALQYDERKQEVSVNACDENAFDFNQIDLNKNEIYKIGVSEVSQFVAK